VFDAVVDPGEPDAERAGRPDAAGSGGPEGEGAAAAGLAREDRDPVARSGTADPVLSGGNQQKVLFARALLTRAPVVLMDDPMRGVDVGTKREVYQMIRAEAEAGRTFVWYSTELEEMELCDRVYVFREGEIVRELTGEEITEEAILAASFKGAACMRITPDTIRPHGAVLALAALLAGVFWLRPNAAMSYNGLNLLFNLAVPIALATLAQMFIMRSTTWTCRWGPLSASSPA
jgi:hypothetical protein